MEETNTLDQSHLAITLTYVGYQACPIGNQTRRRTLTHSIRSIEFLTRCDAFQGRTRGQVLGSVGFLSSDGFVVAPIALKANRTRPEVTKTKCTRAPTMLFHRVYVHSRILPKFLKTLFRILSRCCGKAVRLDDRV